MRMNLYKLFRKTCIRFEQYLCCCNLLNFHAFETFLSRKSLPSSWLKKKSYLNLSLSTLYNHAYMYIVIINIIISSSIIIIIIIIIIP